jgi:hypothetical protein
MTDANCPRCKLEAKGDNEIEAKFGFRKIQDKTISQSWCKQCRSGKSIKEINEIDKNEHKKIESNIQSYVNRLDDLDSLKELFLKPDGLNYNFKNENISTDDWSKESQKSIEQFNVEIKQIAEKVNIEVIYVDIDTNDEKEWKKISKEIFKRRAGYCLIVTHNSREQKKWLFTGSINSSESAKNILLEITNNGVSSKFIEWLGKIKASDDETFTSLISKISYSFDDYAVDIQDKLGENVFNAFETLINEIIFNKDNNLELSDEILKRTNTPLFALLYRLVFVLYAESREIFDTNNKKYFDDFSLKKIVHNLMITYRKNPKSIKLKKYELWNRLQNLFSLVENGSKYLQIDENELHMPAYNGSLFNSEKYPDLRRWKLSNEALLDALHSLTRIQDKENNYSFVNYASIEIRHIGTIYEKLLDFHPETRGKSIEIFTHEGKRESEGTYYTPKFIVDNIVENSLGPLVDKIIKNNKNPRDQAEKILQLKILDPAMGSGHFLVGVAEYLGKKLIHVDNDDSEQNFVERKRDVVRRCLYGVDINPLSVELAKMSLWLDTLSSEHALSFLATHLKNGNGILSSWRKDIFDKQTSLTEDISRTYFRDFVKQYSAFEIIDDHKASTVKAKIEEEKETTQTGSPYDHLKYLFDVQLSKFYGNEIKDWRELRSKIGSKEFDKIVRGIDWSLNRQFSESEKFFHWELEFPQVFFDNDGELLKNPGFDVVLGNPPYGVKYEGEYFENFKLGSKESYGFFMIRALDLVKNKGIVSMVVNDTWRTLTTKKNLRKIILENFHINRLIKLSRYAFKSAGSRNIDAFTIIFEFEKNSSSGAYFYYDLGFMLHPIHDYEFLNSLINYANYKKEKEPWPFDPSITMRYNISQNMIKKSTKMPIFEGDEKIFQLFNKELLPEYVEI